MACQSYDLQGRQRQKATKAGRASHLRQTCFRSGARFSQRQAIGLRQSHLRNVDPGSDQVSFHFRQFFRSLLPPSHLRARILARSRLSLGASQLRRIHPSLQPRKGISLNYKIDNTISIFVATIHCRVSSERRTQIRRAAVIPHCFFVSTYAGPLTRPGQTTAENFDRAVSNKYIRGR